MRATYGFNFTAYGLGDSLTAFALGQEHLDFWLFVGRSWEYDRRLAYPALNRTLQSFSEGPFPCLVGAPRDGIIVSGPEMEDLQRYLPIERGA
jgi:hypothetical protein